MSDLTQAIAEAIWDGIENDGNDSWDRGYVRRSDGVIDVHDIDMDAIARKVAAVVEAHLRPVVTTVKELDALPPTTILHDEDGDIYVINDYQPVNLCAVGQHRYEAPALPAVVLYQPAQEKP